MHLRTLLHYTLILGLFLACQTVARAAITPADQALATARQLIETGHDAQAVGELTKFLAAYPADPRVPDAAFLLGRCYQQQKQFPQALAAFTRAAEKATTPETAKLRAEAYFQMADCHFQLNAFDNAAKAYAACLKVAGADTDLTAQAQYWLGESYYRQGKLTEALQEYRKVIVIAPTHALAPWSLYSVGMICLGQADFDPAIVALEKVTAQFPGAIGEGEVEYLLGLAYAGRAGVVKDAAARDNDLKKATQLLTAVMNNAKADGGTRQQATLALAKATADLGQYLPAAELYAKALPVMDPAAPATLDAHLQRGHALYNAQRYPEAALEYGVVGNAKNVSQLSTTALYWLGNAWYQQSQGTKDVKAFSEAAAAFRRFLTAAGGNHPQASRATLLAALCSEELGARGNATARTAAVNGFKEILQRWPASREAAQASTGIARLTANMTPDELAQVAGGLPDGAAAWSVTLRLAREQFIAGKYQDALTAAQKVLDGKPTADLLAPAAYLVAASLQKLNRPVDAIAAYKQVLANTKAADLTLAAQRGLTQAYLDTRKYAEARDAARALLALPAPTEAAEKEKEIAERCMLLAEACVNVQQYPEALQAYQRVVKDCPTSPMMPHALMGIAWIAEARKDRPAAILAYQEMLAKCPTHAQAPDAAYRLGMACNEQKDYAGAIAAWSKVPATYPQADQAAYAIAWAYRDLNKPEEANAQFLLLATQFPKSPLAGDSQYRVGEYLVEQQKFPEAMQAFTRALDLLPADNKLCPMVAYKLGVCAFTGGNYAAAVAAFARVTTNYAASEYLAESLFWRAQSLEKQGSAAAAREGYGQYLAKFPAGPLAADAALGAGRAALANKQYAACRDDLAKALDLCTQAGQGTNAAMTERAKNVQPEAHFLLGQSYAAEKKYDDALKSYAAVAAVPLEPWFSRSLLEMARCGAQSGDLPAAERTLQLLLTRFPTSDAAKQATALAQEYALKVGEK